MIAARALVLCDGAPASAELAGRQWTDRKAINWRGASAHLHLYAQSLAGTVLTRVTDRAADLVRLAAYVYAADQELSRGGEFDVYARRWQRHIAMCVGVTDPDFWSRGGVCRRLTEALFFLTGD